MEASTHRPERTSAEDLFGDVSNKLLGALVNQGLPRADAEDAVQEAFLRLLTQAAAAQTPDRSDAWLWRAASNIANDIRRRTKTRQRLAHEAGEATRPTEQPTPSASTERDEHNQRVRGVVNQYAIKHPECMAALMLSHVEDFGSTELATMLGRTPAATREYLSQCRKKLRAEFEAAGF